MQSFISFIKGKKSAIGTILGLVITFCLARGYLAGDVATLLSGILAVAGISVNVGEHYINKASE